MTKRIKSFFPILVLFGSSSFTLLYSILGIVYTVGNNAYLYYNLGIAIISYCAFFYMIIKHKTISMSAFYSLLIVLIIPISYITSPFLISGTSGLSKDFFKYFLLWSLPAFLIGMTVAHNRTWNTIVPNFDILMLLISFFITLNSLFFLRQGWRSYSVTGTITYQTVSYLSAFAFALNVYLLIDGKQVNRYRFARSKNYRVICYILLGLQLLSLFIAGGRGSIVLFVVYILFFIFNKSKTKGSRWRIFLVLILTAIVLALLFTSQNTVIMKGINRALGFLDEQGINWKNTSGRGELYLRAIELIQERPWLGYGIFGYLERIDNPHNIVLELLLAGGIVLLAVSIILCILALRKHIRMIKIDPSFKLLAILGPVHTNTASTTIAK